MKPLSEYQLIGFDVDGTLIKGFLETTTCLTCGGSGHDPQMDDRCEPCKGKGQFFGKHLPYENVEVLPGRREKLFFLATKEKRFFLATNQGGVALEYQRPTEVYAKLGKVSAEFENFYGVPVSTHAAFGHKDAKNPYYARQDLLWRRKPNGGMIEDAVDAHGVGLRDTLYVGDLATDKEAAESAGVDFEWAWRFFGDECPTCHGDKTITVNPSRSGDPQLAVDVGCPTCHGGIDG